MLRSVRAILLLDWDPLDIGDNPNLADEYDAYIPGILRLMRERAAADEISQYLEILEIKLQGICGDFGRRYATVTKLLELGDSADLR